MAWVHRLTAIDPAQGVGDCKSCGPNVPLAFRKDRGQWLCRVGRDSRPSDRVTTKRSDHLQRSFGISVDDYDALLAAQNGLCAICLKTCSSGRRLAVDHDHKTGRIRGLLCRRCNTGLGLLGDDPAVISRALAYLDH